MLRPSLLLRLTTLAALVSASLTLPAQPPAAPADPRYRIEIVLFAWNDANRGEEDFHHGHADRLPAPAPQRFRLPPLELESLFEPLLPLPPDATDATEPAAGFGAESGQSTVAADPGAAGALAPDGLPPAIGSALPAEAAVAGPLLELIETATGRPPQARELAAAAAPLPDGFRILRADELELTADAARLSRGAYRLLGHVGWEQTGVDTDRSTAIDLARLGITNPTGSLEFYIRRFRHVIVDLEYHDGRGSLWTADAGPGLTLLRYAESYRLQTEENSITDLRYADHPLFGLLIWITRAPDPAPELPAGAPGGPAA